MKYTVMPGDTMYKIAQRHGVTLDELIAANPGISDPDLIYPGQVIQVPVSKPGVKLPELPPEEEFPSFPPGPAGPLHPPEFPGFLPGIPHELGPGGGMMPGFPGGGMMPGFPGGGMMPGFPGGGMMPGFPGGGMMPGFPVTPLEVQGFRQGDKGEHIRYLQKRLKEMGYYRGSVSGRFGSMTKCAVKRLQKDYGLPVNGIVDNYVWAGITGHY